MIIVFPTDEIDTVPKRRVRSSMFTAILTWFHLSDYSNFSIMKDGNFVINNSASLTCFICRNPFQNGANDMSEMVNM